VAQLGQLLLVRVVPERCLVWVVNLVPILVYGKARLLSGVMVAVQAVAQRGLAVVVAVLMVALAVVVVDQTHQERAEVFIQEVVM
jgi:hypothetical protein